MPPRKTKPQPSPPPPPFDYKVFGTRTARGYIDTFSGVSIDCEALRQEIMEIHEGRWARKLVKRISPERLRKAAAHELAMRSRIVKIFAECNSIATRASELRDAVVSDLLFKYGDRLSVTTATHRQAFLKTGLEKRVPVMADIRDVRDRAKYVLDDIDAADWKLKTMQATYTQVTRPEANL